MYPVRRQISRHASALRRDMTDVERLLWNALRNRQLEGFKFRRQATVGPFVTDLLCVEAGLVVELDGGQHDAGRDERRSAFLQEKGLRVVRFWNHDVKDNFEGVVEVIRAELLQGKKRKTLTQPSPAKAGEG
ncbi:MAG: endonuclease domain-containing protein [Sphingobium sp.]